MYKLQLTSLQEEIIRLLFRRAGKQLNQRQIPNSLQVTPLVVMKALPLLERENFIKMRKDKEIKIKRIIKNALT